MNHEGKAQEGTVESASGQGYVLFAIAEQKHITVTKLLTGRDRPLLNLEYALLNTYALAKQRLQRQQERKAGKRGRR